MSQANKKILIVDDSAFMRGVLKVIVTKSHWKDAEIVEATDGEEAIAKFNSEKPDLVLLDIIIAKKNGIEVLKHIGSSASAVVMVSSIGQEEVINQAKALGAKDYIVKPFDQSNVINILNKFLPS